MRTFYSGRIPTKKRPDGRSNAVTSQSRPVLTSLVVAVHRIKVLTSLVGKVPTNPLWAELLAARHRHAIAKAQARKASVATEAASELNK